MKSVFITGGTSGIGADMAKLYFDRGFRVAVCGRSQSRFSENLSNDKILFYEVDVSNKDSVQVAIADFAKHGLDIVIANAGTSHKRKSSIPDFDDCHRLVSINITGVLNTFDAATKIFLEKGEGQLVAISSIAGFNGLPGAPAYSASKSFVSSFCESISLTLKDKNIAVTCICPGFIDTPLTRTNKHPMPFLKNSKDAAEKFIEAINKKKVIFIYPGLFGHLVALLGKLPRRLYRFLILRSRMNYTKS